MNREETARENLGRVLYRQPPESRGLRTSVLAVVFGMPWLLVPYVEPGLTSYLACAAGLAAGVVLAILVDRLIRLRFDTTIHEHGALIRVDGERELLWFTDATTVTEIHEIMRTYGEPDEDSWVFEVRTAEGRTLALSTYAPGPAERIRRALTRALGHPPRLVQRR